MDIWSLLEIDASTDIRVIKRAYASKLKVTRPDEQPEAFQRLHYAYKTALNYAYEEQHRLTQEQSAADTVLPSDRSSEQPTTESSLPAQTPEAQDVAHEAVSPVHETESSELELDLSSTLETPAIEDESSDVPESTESDTEQEPNPYQQEGERLIALVQLLLNTSQDLHIPESWAFLMNSPFILDDQFNWRLGLEVLRLIHAHNQHNANKPMIQIGSGVLSYLDGIFNWKLNQHYIYRFFDESTFAPLLEKIVEHEPLQQTQHALDGLRGAKSIKVIESHKQPNTLYYASPVKRFIALLIDIAGMFLIVTLILHDLAYKAIQPDHPNISSETAMAVTFILSFIYFWVCECSSTQATLGKLIMGLVVTNKDFEPMTHMQGFFRSLVFHLSSLLSYIVLIINAMMGDKLLHDRITKTYVIDLRRSRQS